VNLLQLPARLRRQLTLSQQRLHPAGQDPAKLPVVLQEPPAPLKQRPQRMRVEVGQWFGGDQVGGKPLSWLTAGGRLGRWS
jgi:hypothetical protein